MDNEVSPSMPLLIAGPTAWPMLNAPGTLSLWRFRVRCREESFVAGVRARVRREITAFQESIQAKGRAIASPFISAHRSITLFAANFWRTRWMVRQGFLWAMLISVSIIGSTLWAIASLPYFPAAGIPEMPSLIMPSMSVARPGSPGELSWFFVEYPYVTSGAAIRAKNHHTFLISDPARHREYVVILAQSFRRVEVYFGDKKGSSQVQVFTPGTKRTVTFDHGAVLSTNSKPDANLWMWQRPLWNPLHLKIYTLADLWLDAPYKRYSCAGFVHQFLGEAGVRVPILDAWDMAKQPWTRVPADEMEPGDIITIRAASASHRRFWKHSITHVGVYLGNGKMIHAATPSRQARRSWVRIVSVDVFRKRIDKILRPPNLL